MSDLDARVRLAAFEFLRRELTGDRDVIHWNRLAEGFELDGERVHLVAQQGIFKPRILTIPLTILSSPDGPYEDRFDHDGLLIYRFRGTNPNHRDNAGLREAMRLHKPLAYFRGIGEGEYVPEWPIFVVDEGVDQGGGFFRVAFPESASLATEAVSGAGISLDGIRRYVTVESVQRVHQRPFSARVRRAYENRCAVCRLGHRSLLDAAHILPDRHPRGDAVVTNGLLLCKLHHSALDANLIGIDSQSVIHVKHSILEEPDGPLLEYGLKRFQHEILRNPRHRSERPNPDFLHERFEDFLRAG